MVVVGLFVGYVRLQAFVEVMCTHAGIDDSYDDQDDGENGESCQLLPHRSVGYSSSWRIHPHQLKQEIG